MSKKKKIVIKLLMCVLLYLVALTIYQNNSFIVTNLVINDNRTKEDIRVVQISDLHNKSFDQNQDKLSKAIKDSNPDIILITGDVVSYHDTNFAPIEKLLDNINGYKIYYSIGNHEAANENLEKILTLMEQKGVKVLMNESEEIYVNETPLNIVGLNDRSYSGIKEMRSTIVNKSSEDKLNIYLAHRPELLYMYSEVGNGIFFSGHAHGGQVRLPIIGALYAPGQSIAPAYTEGIHRENNATMVVSRGLGDSKFPVRIFNQPELIIVDIKP